MTPDNSFNEHETVASTGTDNTADKPEHQESVWWLTLAPSLWTVHFLASYLTAAIYCEKATIVPEGQSVDAWPVQLAILIYTLLALPLICLVAWHGFERHTFDNAELPHDFDSSGDRHRFLGFATFLLAVLSAVATIFTGLVVVFVGSCD